MDNPNLSISTAKTTITGGWICLNLQDLQRQIADLRAELAVLVKSEEDLSRPEVIAKSKELKELIFLYYRLTSSGNEPEDPIHLQTV